MDKEIYDIITRLLEYCVMGIRNYNSKYDKEYFLKFEIQHLRILLDTIKGDISLIEYAKKLNQTLENFKNTPNYDTIYQYYEFYFGWLFNQDCYMKVFMQSNEFLHKIDDNFTIFIDILELLYNNALEHLQNNRYDLINHEGYICHNIPFIFNDFNLGKVDYYIKYETFGSGLCYKFTQIPYEYLSRYFPLWLKVAEIFQFKKLWIYKFKLWKYSLYHKNIT